MVTVQSVSANSQMPTPTPEQIEQFKKLPRAQQEAIAQQYGISIVEKFWMPEKWLPVNSYQVKR